MRPSEKHSRLIQLRVTEAEYEELRKVADRRGLELSPVIRELLFQPATPQRVLRNVDSPAKR